MANLDKSNVVNGNIIEASDIVALYDTFTGDNTANNIDIQGANNNFAGTSSKADNLRYTNGSSNHEYPVVFVTGSAQYKTAFVDSNNKITYNPSSNLLTTTASLAVTASYVASTEQSDTLVVNTSGGGNRKGYAFAGVSPGGVPVDFTVNHAGIPIPTTLGTDFTVTANDASNPVPNTIGISYSAPNITFVNAGGADVVYQGWVWT